MSKEILVIRLSSLGDIVTTDPVLFYLKKEINDCRITFITSSRYKGLMDSHPDIDDIKFIETRGRHRDKKGLAEFLKQEKLINKKFDYLLDLHNNFRSIYLRYKIPADRKLTWNNQALKRNLLVMFHFHPNISHVTARYMKVFKGILRIPGKKQYRYRFFSDPDTKVKMLSKFPNLKDCGLVFPGSMWKTKMYPAEYYIQIIKQLPFDFIIMGTEDENEVCTKIANTTNSKNLAGKLSLRETGAMIDLSKLVITNDSGPMHMSSGAGKPTIAFFGSTTPELGFSPNPENSLVIEDNNLNCRPCSLHGWEECPKNHFKCMLNLKPNSELTDKITDFIKSRVNNG